MTKGYDNPVRSDYFHAGVDFGAGADIEFVLAVPLSGRDSVIPGTRMRGRVVGVTIHNITEVFAGSTLDAGVQVGDGSDPDLYFEDGRTLDETVDTAESVYLQDDGAGVDIPAGEAEITVTCQVATGTPTGIADMTVHIDWFG